MRRAIAFIALGGIVLAAPSARADDADENDQRAGKVERPALPEPIFSETVTDLDGHEAGEMEFEANASVLRAMRGGAHAIDASFEVEWLATDRIGLRLEPAIGDDRGDGVGEGFDYGASAGASYKLFHDFEHDFHLQIETLARLPWNESAIVQPGDPWLPLAFDLRAGWRTGPMTWRWSVGWGTGDSDAVHLPLRGSFAALAPLGEDTRFGFFGVEVDADGARTAPVVVAANLVPNLLPAGVPFRIGAAIPWAVGEREDRPSLGFFLRIFYESERERREVTSTRR